MITYSEEIDRPELEKSLKINTNVTQNIRERIISFIKQYWDCFAKRGCRLTIIVYAFSIYTSTASPVFYKKPRYGLGESDIIMEQIHNLLKSDWI